jgi:hypothetical protein
MEITFVVAKVLGIYLIVSGLAMAGQKKTLTAVLKDFYAHPATVWLGGIFLIFLGGLMVVMHNIWTGGLTTFVTVVAWLTLLKGVLYLLFPGKIFAVGEKFLAHAAPLGLLGAVVGVWLILISR